MSKKEIPKEIKDYIFSMASNKCKTCNVICRIPYKKISKFYYCNRVCFYHN